MKLHRVKVLKSFVTLLVVRRTKVNTFDMGSFLIKPLQRVLKYPLLLENLLQRTQQPEPPADCTSYRDLMVAVKQIQDVANLVNEEKRKKDLGSDF